MVFPTAAFSIRFSYSVLKVHSFFRAPRFSHTSLITERLRSVMGSSGLEPPTSRLSGARSNRLSYEPFSIMLSRAFPAGLYGDEQARTVDPLLAKQVLSQLSYTPITLPGAFEFFYSLVIRVPRKLNNGISHRKS